jgi:hypothetical protein
MATIGDWIGVSIPDETRINVALPDIVAPFAGIDTYLAGVRTEIVVPSTEQLIVETWDRAPSEVTPGQTEVPMLQMNMSVGAPTGIIKLDSVRIDLTGLPPTSNDISSVELWLDIDENDIFDPMMDALIAPPETFSPPPCPCSVAFLLSGYPQIQPGMVTKLFVTYSIENTPVATNGDWIGASIADETYIAVNTPDTVMAFTGIDTYVPGNRTQITSPDSKPLVEAWEPGGSSPQTYYQGDLIMVTWSATDDNQLPPNPINITYGAAPIWNIISTGESNDGSYLWDTSLVPCPGTYWMNISVYDSIGQTTFDESNFSFAQEVLPCSRSSRET